MKIIDMKINKIWNCFIKDPVIKVSNAPPVIKMYEYFSNPLDLVKETLI